MDASRKPALIFDLDGTLVDSVYQHVLAWRTALEAEGLDLPTWRIHRRVGMSNGLLVNGLAREMGRDFSTEEVAALQAAHARAFRELAPHVRPLPGAIALLHQLSERGVLWAIATSGSRATAGPNLAKLEVPPSVPVITRDEVPFAKPDPDLFLAAAARLGVAITNCVVVGDSIWDVLAARRAGALGVGLLSGGYSRQELEEVGAFRVYDDPEALRVHLDELGIRR
ncbi:MAG: HAD family phosphatase [Candidatus Dormiibacterota bacterium]|jgi:HAD superfamily hydrolase (TIGR01509 family)